MCTIFIFINFNYIRYVNDCRMRRWMTQSWCCAMRRRMDVPIDKSQDHQMEKVFKSKVSKNKIWIQQQKQLVERREHAHIKIKLVRNATINHMQSNRRSSVLVGYKLNRIRKKSENNHWYTRTCLKHLEKDNLYTEKWFQSIDLVLVHEVLEVKQVYFGVLYWFDLLNGSACGKTLGFFGRISFHGGMYSGGGGGSNGISRMVVNNIVVEKVSFRL